MGQEFQNSFQVQVAGFPTLLVVSSSAKVMDQLVGAPENESKLADLLRNGLASQTSGQFGGRVSPAVLMGPRIRSTLRAVKKLRAENRTAEAIKLVAPYAKSKAQPKTDTGKSLVEEVQRLNEEGQKELEAAREKIQTDGKQLQGAVALAKVHRIYGRLPAMKASLSAEMRNMRQQSDDLKLSAKVKAIDKARAFEEAGQNRKAVSAYKKVVSRYPDSQAAKLCEKRIRQLEKE